MLSMDRYESCSELEAIILAPFLHDLHEVLYLRIVRVLQHVDNLDESLLIFCSSHYHLENADGGTTLTFPEFWVSIKSLENIEGLDREVELAHLVAIVSDQIQKRQALIRGLHVNVDIPG